MLRGFTDFVREQGVVGIAVGIAIGIQASNFVSSIVEWFIDPLVGVILRGTDLTSIQSSAYIGGEDLVFGWGYILQALITFLATALVVYVLVKQAKLDRLDKPKKK